MTTLFEASARALLAEAGLSECPRSGYELAAALRVQVVPGLRTGESARLLGDRFVHVDDRQGERVRHCAIARELGLLALMRAGYPLSLDDAEAVGALLTLPSAAIAGAFRGLTPPELHACYPWTTYDLLARRLSAFGSVVTLYRAGRPIRRFCPSWVRADEVTLTEHRLAERARVTPCAGRALSSQGAQAFAVREPGGAEVVTVLSAVGLRLARRTATTAPVAAALRFG